MTHHRTLGIGALAVLLPIAGCTDAESRAAPPEAAAEADAPAASRTGAEAMASVRHEVVATAEDSALVAATFDWAAETRADTLPTGALVVGVARRFLGAPYIAGSLDPPGPERLIVNLRAFDCVTFVESALALARAIRSRPDFDGFVHELAAIRYRDDGRDYTDRLHYFSEWIAANSSAGIVEDVTAAIGGERDVRPIRFMSEHASAYPQLADPSNLEAIRVIETGLTSRPRYRIPEQRIAEVADGISSGDVIAATSTVAGLDVAHTGIAIRVDGRVHLMHAPLAGGVVEISDVPLAERIQRIGGQDGIMVARPR